MTSLILTLLTAAPQIAAGDLKVLDAWVMSSTQSEAEREKVALALLDKKPELAKTFSEKSPLLQHALDNAGVEGDLGRRSRKLAELLLAKGADANATASSGDPLLVHYARFARVAPMEILLAKGAKPDAVDADGRTALHWVALLLELEKEAAHVDKNLKAATLLLDAKASVDAKDKRGSTPLASTAFVGNLKMTELLLARGADINAKNNDGYSVLGGCKLRVESGPKKPVFANSKEVAATRAVIAFLEKKGAKDEQPDR